MLNPQDLLDVTMFLYLRDRLKLKRNNVKRNYKNKIENLY